MRKSSTIVFGWVGIRLFLILLGVVLGLLPLSGQDKMRFESSGDIGSPTLKGKWVFQAEGNKYLVTGGGVNMWGSRDAFYFVRSQVEGDLSMTAKVGFLGEGKNAHRKGGWMVRESLEPDSPYADAVVHGDGLISLQYRKVKGGETAEVQSPVRTPALLRFERTGDVFTLSVSRNGASFLPVGSILLPLSSKAYAGLAVCSHEESILETAVFSDLSLNITKEVPMNKRVVESTLEIISIASGERRIVYRAADHFEAPNWTPDGKQLLINRKGRLYTIPVAGGELKQLETGKATQCNNDHGISFDGKWLAISHSPAGKSLIYVLPATGGEPRLVTPLGPSYWHGWSPDGKTLTYCAERKGEYDIYAIPVEGGEEKRLTTAPGLDDGPEYSPDGEFIYFNSERTGAMRIWRMKPDGSGQEQVTIDEEYGDWFPHPSPDGKWLVFLSYDKSVKGHPPNQDVVLRILPTAGGKPKILARLFGGQGTVNVPSWSPDSKEFAFVSYRLVVPGI